MTPRSIMETEARPFATNSTIPMLGREQPYGMSTSIMTNLQINHATFANSDVRIRQSWCLDRP